jgi:hypothetical protein
MPNQGNPRDSNRGIQRAKLLIEAKLVGYKTPQEKRLRLAEIRANLASQLDACAEIQRDLAQLEAD